MAIPWVSGALRGWTKRRQVRIVSKTIVDHLVVQSASIVIADLMIQPLQPWKVNRKPEEQRNWQWFELISTLSSPVFTYDTQVWIDGIGYRIESKQPWEEGGYRRYEAREDYSGNDPTDGTT